MKNYLLKYFAEASYNPNRKYPFSSEISGFPVVSYGKDFWELRDNTKENLQFFLLRFFLKSGRIPLLIKDFSNLEKTNFLVEFNSKDLVKKALFQHSYHFL